MKFFSVALALAIASVCQDGAHAFVSPSSSSPRLSSSAGHLCQSSFPIQQRTYHTQQLHRRSRLFNTASDTDLETEVKSMRVAAIKQELESYGISTKTFLEKSELVDALVQARKEGKTPVATASSSSGSAYSSSSASSTSSSSASTTSTAATPLSPEERQSRIQEEMTKASSQKVSELKAELESYGVSTKSYFEKSEFVRAVAEARVDGVKKSKKKKRRDTVVVDGEEVEEVAAKVEVITNDNVGPKTKKSRDADQGGGGNPFGGAGGSPFGSSAGSPFGGGAGGGSPFGGMGGMGGIEDILKGMGGMGGGGTAGGSPFGGAAGANPFAGAAGGNPFGGGAGMGDAMKAAQEAMKNPKVMAVIQKAQKNPKVMQAVQECMGNPMAMSKYMSDPEVGPILKELQDAMM